MGKFEGPFGAPTPERVFEDYNEKCRKNSNNCIDDLYSYCDDLDDSIGDLYDSTKNRISKLQNQIYDIDIENELLKNTVSNMKKQIQKLTESINKMEKPHLINPIIRI